MRWERDEYWITDDTGLADLDFVTEALQTTYWAAGRPREVVERSVEHSVLLSLFQGERPIGFTRLVSDWATFAWICDVFVLPEFRGRGLGKWLVECTVNHPAAQVRRLILATRDAHGLYEQYGFERFEAMTRRNPAS